MPPFTAPPLSRTSTFTDDEYDDDDYDWSGDEDLGNEEARFQDRMGVKKKRKGWGFKRILTLLFSSLIGSTFLAGVIVTPGILIQFFWYKNNPTDYRLRVKQNVQAWTFWAAANLIVSWWLALIVDLVPVVFRYLVMAAWGHVSETIKTRIELFQSVKNTVKPLLYAASGWVSWVIIFEHIYKLYDADEDNSREQYTNRVYQVIQFLFFFALVVCIQKMLSHAIAFSFHRTAFKDRLDVLAEALPAIEKLRDYSPPKHARHRSNGFRTPGLTPTLEKSGFTWNASNNGHADEGMMADTEDADRTMVNTGKKNKTRRRMLFFSSKEPSQSSLEAAEMGVLPNRPAESRPVTPGSTVHRYPPVDSRRSSDSDAINAQETIASAAKMLKSAVLHDARNIKGDDANEKSLLLGGGGTIDEAKHLARSVYTKFRPHHAGRNYLLPSDFYPAFPTHEAAEAAFRVFDSDNNGDISRGEIKSTLVKVYKERRFLARSMRDVGAALKTLDHILLFFAMVILFFISLSVFGVEVGDSLTSVYTLGIAASFIFKTAASNAFDAIMFLFVTHPFDTGDRCFIDDENLIVKKMGLFATVFTRVDGTESYYFNSQLFNKFITNVRRSDKMFENCTIQVAWTTPLEKLDELERCMNDWLQTEENRWFAPATSLVLQHIDYQRYLEITIGCLHNGTWQDWGLRCARKTAFHAAVQYFCRQIGIVGYEAPLPIVYGDPDTLVYQPPSPGAGGDEDTPYDGLDGGASRDHLDKVNDVATAPAKPTLGFLPPATSRNGGNMRQRKHSRKAILRAMDG
ncbi:hypothetical protein CYLTODRAFT_343298 [Cylindrobasidium torrendii FP15055 ss-10]|uniref:EF-hand domain-containing protein n=1 Tax=Cylindrobasidium torrendii FP15055 ss-10 TaxID=1314674 RepID=A0A0D7BR30_9AGAR|nr:hypothetical protein CYLTODRAFT_343298 [Cylindrobasidium torrendii FP15055 ss-10]